MPYCYQNVECTIHNQVNVFLCISTIHLQHFKVFRELLKFLLSACSYVFHQLKSILFFIYTYKAGNKKNLNWLILVFKERTCSIHVNRNSRNRFLFSIKKMFFFGKSSMFAQSYNLKNKTTFHLSEKNCKNHS